MDLQTNEHPIHPIIIILLAILIFYIPFETMGMEQSGRTFTYSKIVGYVFFASCFILDRERCFGFPPKAFWCFSFYLLMYSISGFFQEASFQDAIIERAITIIQMLMFFWVSFNILKFADYSNIMIYSLAISCIIISSLQLAGITVTEYLDDVSRLSFLEEDPNTAGSILALGAVCLVGIIFKEEDLFSLHGGICFIFLIVVFVALVKTGSRGALLSLIVGMAVYVMASSDVKVKKMRYMLLSILLLIFALWIAYSYDFMRMRIEETIYSGNFARREIIIPVVLDMIIEKPILGWGAFTNIVELGHRTGAIFVKDTHNTLLFVLTEVGILGAIPFFIGLYLCVRSSVRSNRTLFNPLPFSLVMTLVIINLSLTWHNRKFFWFVLALSLASGFQVNKASESINSLPTALSFHSFSGNKLEKERS
ncbi:MAG: O-antigen ligase family protein [bacterium]